MVVHRINVIPIFTVKMVNPVSQSPLWIWLIIFKEFFSPLWFNSQIFQIHACTFFLLATFRATIGKSLASTGKWSSSSRQWQIKAINGVLLFSFFQAFTFTNDGWQLSNLSFQSRLYLSSMINIQPFEFPTVPKQDPISSNWSCRLTLLILHD